MFALLGKKKAKKKKSKLGPLIGLIAFILLVAGTGGAKKIITHHAPADSPPPPVSVSVNSNEKLANKMAGSSPYYWHGSQITCLDYLWTRESGFSSTALNASSQATGIPQLLPSAHKIPAGWSRPSVQIAWGLNYISGRYGTPCGAWDQYCIHPGGACWY